MYWSCLTFGHPAAPREDSLLATCPVSGVHLIAAQGHVLTPGRYVGAVPGGENAEPFDTRIRRMTGELAAQMEEATSLDIRIREQLAGVGYGW